MLRILSLLFLIAFAGAAAAEKRVALVIGNSNYKYAPELANPKNDAADVSNVMRELGITVIEGKDLDKPGMDRAVRSFATALTGADVGIFFYAGHGLQVNGSNFLVPIDAELSTTTALEFEMVRLDLVQRIMEAETKTNIVFLDACRNNPLARNLARAMGTRSASIGKGLAPAESGIGTLVSFSTQPGNVALDGTGRNSPYSGALIKNLKVQGEDIVSVLTLVRNDVLEATAQQQVPWENHALRSRFFFNPAPAASASASSTAVALIQPAAPALPPDVERAWAVVKETNDAAVLESFLRRFDDVFYGDLARSRLGDLHAKDKQSEIASGNRGVALAPRSAAAYHKRGVALYNAKEYVRAVADFNTSIALDAKAGDSYLYRGIAFARQNDFLRAIPDYTKAIELNVHEIDLVYNNRGVAYQNSNQPDKALPDYTKSLELNPKASRYVGRGKVYRELKRCTEALADYAKAIELEPKYPDTYVSQGLCYADMNNRDAEIAAYTKAIELGYKGNHAHRNRGLIYWKSNDYDKAFADFDKAVQLDSKDALAYMNRADIYEARGMIDKAQADIAKALELQPDNKFAIERRDRLQLKARKG